MAIKTGWATALSAIIGALKDRDLSRGFQPSANGGVKNTMTNADLIRKMTDKELAMWIAENTGCNDWCMLSKKCMSNHDCCIDMWFDWLRSEEDEHTD